MRSVAAASLALAAFAEQLPGEKDWAGYTFEQYVKDFGRDYSPNQNGLRRSNFEATLKKVLEHNAQEDKTWFATINLFF